MTAASSKPGWSGEVWVVLTPGRSGELRDLEVLDSPPKWDLAALGQTCRTGFVNGGDSIEWHAPAPSAGPVREPRSILPTASR